MILLYLASGIIAKLAIHFVFYNTAKLIIIFQSRVRYIRMSTRRRPEIHHATLPYAIM